VVTAADDGQVRIWSTRTGLVERTLDAGGRARAIALSPDGDQLLTATETGHARVFAMADGTLLESRPGAGQGHPVLAWSPDGRRYLVVSFGEAARVFTRGAPDPIVLEGQDRALAVSALDDGRLWLASRRAPALLFSPEGRRIGALGESTDTTAVASGPGSHALAFGGLDGTVRIVEIPAPGGAAKPGRVIGRLTGGVQALAFSPDGTRLMAGGRDGGIALLRATGGDDVPLLGHTGWILKGEFDRAGEHVVSASGDASARVWNVPRGRLETVLAGHTARVIDVSFSPDGKQIVTASLDGTVRLWLARDPELLAAFSPPPSQPAILHFAETGELFVVSQEGITSAWRVAGGTPTAVLTTGPRALRDVVPLPDGFLVLSPDGSRRVTPAGEHPVEIALEQAVGAALLEAEGPLALVSEAEIVLVAPESGQVIGRWRTGASQPTSVCAIPGGRLAVATQGGHVIVWDVSARRALHQLDHPPLIMFQAATRRGELLTAGEDGTVRIWRKDGTLGGTLEGHTDAVRAVAVSADGEIVATGGSDGSVRVWELERRRLLATFRPSGREIITLAFDAKRDRVAAGDGTGEVFVWDVRDYRGTAEELGASIGCLVPFAFRDGGLVAREITTCGATR
jgi:WD40 repeat protein